MDIHTYPIGALSFAGSAHLCTCSFVHLLHIWAPIGAHLSTNLLHKLAGKGEAESGSSGVRVYVTTYKLVAPDPGSGQERKGEPPRGPGSDPVGLQIIIWEKPLMGCFSEEIASPISLDK